MWPTVTPQLGLQRCVELPFRRSCTTPLRAPRTASPQTIPRSAHAELGRTHWHRTPQLRSFPHCWKRPDGDSFLHGRLCVTDTVVRGKRIAAGTKLWLNVMAIHHDPAHYADPQVASLSQLAR